MAEEPRKHPSGLPYYVPEQPEPVQAAAGGVLAGIRSWFERQITGAAQMDAPAPKETPIPRNVHEAMARGETKYISGGVTFHFRGAERKKELPRYEDAIAGVTDGPKYPYGNPVDAPSQAVPSSQLKPYQGKS